MDVCFSDLASKFRKHIKINNQDIKLVDGKEPSYRAIYKIRTGKII